MDYNYTAPNFMSTDNWLLSIPGEEEMVYGVRTFTLPGMTLGNISMPSTSNIIPQLNGDKIVFDPLNLTFLVDENLKNYQKMIDWLMQNSNSDIPVTKDITLTVLNNAKLTQGLAIRFVNAFPISLTAIDFDPEGELEQVESSVTLVFDYFTVVRNDDDGYYEAIQV